LIDRLNADLEDAWEGNFPSIFIEEWTTGSIRYSPASPQFKNIPSKLLDIFSISANAREAIFSGPIRSFLHLIFERSILAFQSLSFLTGSGQPMHQDCAFVEVSSPMEFA